MCIMYDEMHVEKSKWAIFKNNRFYFSVISCKTIQGYFVMYMTVFKLFWRLFDSNFGWFCYFNSIQAILRCDSPGSLFLSLYHRRSWLYPFSFPVSYQRAMTRNGLYSALSYMRESFQWGFFEFFIKAFWIRREKRKYIVMHICLYIKSSNFFMFPVILKFTNRMCLLWYFDSLTFCDFRNFEICSSFTASFKFNW